MFIAPIQIAHLKYLYNIYSTTSEFGELLIPIYEIITDFMNNNFNQYKIYSIQIFGSVFLIRDFQPYEFDCPGVSIFVMKICNDYIHYHDYNFCIIIVTKCTGFTTQDNEINFYLPLMCLKIDCDIGKESVDSINLVICYNLQVSDNFLECIEYGMTRKLMGYLNTNTFHVIDIVNILYPIWLPHACFFKSTHNKSNCCTCDTNQLHHNFSNNAFFVGIFGNKWNVLHWKPVCENDCIDDENINPERIADEDDCKKEVLSETNIVECYQPPCKKIRLSKF